MFLFVMEVASEVYEWSVEKTCSKENYIAKNNDVNQNFSTKHSIECTKSEKYCVQKLGNHSRAIVANPQIFTTATKLFARDRKSTRLNSSH